MIIATVEMNNAGWYVAWFDDERPDMVHPYWYGPRAECLAKAQEPAPKRGWKKGDFYRGESLSYSDILRDGMDE